VKKRKKRKKMAEDKREDVESQVVSEMHKKGRDGSYLELDVSKMGDLVKIVREGGEWPKMVVLKSFRIELSEQDHVEGLCCAIQAHLDGETELNDDQIGFKAFRSSLEFGLVELD
jgi:hypothetical protein